MSEVDITQKLTEATLNLTCADGVTSHADEPSCTLNFGPVPADKEMSFPGKKKRDVKLPNLRIFYGTFVHCIDKKSFIILERWMLGIEHGKIVLSEPVAKYTDVLIDWGVKEFAKEITITLGEGTLMLPGFVDAHTDAASFLGLGIQDYASSNTLSGSRHQDKLNLIHDDRIAGQLFQKVIERTINHGSTTVSYNGTHIESAVRSLAKYLALHKQRSSVSIDVCVPGQREDDHMGQMTKAHEVISHIKQFKGSGVQVNLQVSAPLPAWLEDRAANIHQMENIPVKVYVTDEKENAMVDLSGTAIILHHMNHGLLNDKTLVVMCSDCDPDDLTQIEQAGAGVIFCPSDVIKSGNSWLLETLLESDIKLGLGTNMVTSHSYSILNAIQSCAEIHRLPKIARERKVKIDGLNEDSEGIVIGKVKRQPILHQVNYQQYFYMATLGGAEVLGMDNLVGNFEVGKEFDAILVDPHVPNSPFFTVLNKDSAQDILERFLFAGGEENITAVYISGQRVK